MAKDSLIERLENLPQDRKAMLNRLRRVEGQLRGIQRMIIEEKPCYDVLLQLSAARKAMQRACIEILKNYLQNASMRQKPLILTTLRSSSKRLSKFLPPPGHILRKGTNKRNRLRETQFPRGTRKILLTAAPFRA